MNIKKIFFAAIFLLVIICFNPKAYAGIKNIKMILQIDVRTNAAVRSRLTILVNDENPYNKATLFFIHGMSHTVKTYNPWAGRILKTSPFMEKVSRIIILDLPARGGSSLPLNSGVLYGDLDLDDYTTIVVKALRQLKLLKITPDIIISHSMGSIVLQMVQQRLINQGGTLWANFGVKNVLMIAPVLPRQISWAFADSGTAEQIIGPYVKTNSNLGTHIDIPAAVWIQFFFTNSNGNIVPGTPTAEQITSRGYNAKESFSAVIQMIGSTNYGVKRPSIASGIYLNSYKTKLSIISYQEDTLFFNYPIEHQNLYVHLTGDQSLANFITIENNYAVHDTHISDSSILDGILLQILQDF